MRNCMLASKQIFTGKKEKCRSQSGSFQERRIELFPKQKAQQSKIQNSINIKQQNQQISNTLPQTGSRILGQSFNDNIINLPNMRQTSMRQNIELTPDSEKPNTENRPNWTISRISSAELMIDFYHPSLLSTSHSIDKYQRVLLSQIEAC